MANVKFEKAVYAGGARTIFCFLLFLFYAYKSDAFGENNIDSQLIFVLAVSVAIK